MKLGREITQNGSRGRQDFWNVELIVSRLLGAGNIMKPLLMQKIMQDTREKFSGGAGDNVSCESAEQYVHAESQESN